MHLDIILLLGLAALAVWTEVDKLWRRGEYRDNEPLPKHAMPIKQLGRADVWHRVQVPVRPSYGCYRVSIKADEHQGG